METTRTGRSRCFRATARSIAVCFLGLLTGITWSAVPTEGRFASAMIKAAQTGDEGAVRDLRSRLEAQGKPVRGDRKAARALNTEALKLLKENNTAEAIDKLVRAARADGGDAEILGNLGYALQTADRHVEAKPVLERAVELAPGRSATWGNLGESYAHLGDEQAATAAFRITYLFSRNQEKTKDYFNMLIWEPGAPPALVVAATVAKDHPELSAARPPPHGGSEWSAGSRALDPSTVTGEDEPSVIQDVRSNNASAANVSAATPSGLVRSPSRDAPAPSTAEIRSVQDEPQDATHESRSKSLVAIGAASASFPSAVASPVDQSFATASRQQPVNTAEQRPFPELSGVRNGQEPELLARRVDRPGLPADLSGFQQMAKDLVVTVGIAVIVAFLAMLVAGATDKLVIYYDRADLFISIMPWVSLLSGIALRSSYEHPAMQEIALYAGIALSVLFALWSLSLSIASNRSVFVGLLVGVFKLLSALLGTLVFVGLLYEIMVKTRERESLIVKLAGVGLIIWLANRLVNGKRVYRARGWPLPRGAS